MKSIEVNLVYHMTSPRIHITPCIKIDKPLSVYNLVAAITTSRVYGKILSFAY